jgi:hypothetical protein
MRRLLVVVGFFITGLFIVTGCTDSGKNSEIETDTGSVDTDVDADTDTDSDTDTDTDADTDTDTDADSDANAKEYCSSGQNAVGNGYHYEMWIQDGTQGTACMTVYGDDAKFKVDWDLGGYGFVARVGLKYNETQTAEEIGWFSSDYAFTKSGNGMAYMGIYGWMVNPLKEYYIVEDWNGWRPQYTEMGTITVDGGKYDVYTNMRNQQPSIKGTQTFEQWFSVRQTPRQSGHISISEHFAQWAALGMEQGDMYEAKLKVEGLGGSGIVDFTSATVVVGDKPAALKQ